MHRWCAPFGVVVRVTGIFSNGISLHFPLPLLFRMIDHFHCTLCPFQSHGVAPVALRGLLASGPQGAPQAPHGGNINKKEKPPFNGRLETMVPCIACRQWYQAGCVHGCVHTIALNKRETMALA